MIAGGETLAASGYDPETPAEAAEAMTAAARAGAGVAIEGGGTHAVPLAATAVRLRTRGLRRVVEFAPEDQTVTVESGITLAELDAVLAEKGQRLMLDVARPERSTIGGALAANAFGARRHTYGTFKDLILGVSVVRVDGTAARAGGNVVKNVAGFDLSKLMVGSFGTLALVTTATLRVHPRPEAARAFRISELSAAGLWHAILTMRERRLTPTAAIATRVAGRPTLDLDVLFEGFAASVDGSAARTETVAAALQRDATERDPAEFARDDAAARDGAPLRVRLTTLPADFADVDERIVAPLLGTLAGGAHVAYPTIGVVYTGGTPHESDAAGRAVAGARGEAERLGGSLVVEARPAGFAPGVDAWGTAPPSLSLMRTLKSRFDSGGRLNPGAFGGLW